VRWLFKRGLTAASSDKADGLLWTAFELSQPAAQAPPDGVATAGVLAQPTDREDR
jgi:hypothetical protein